MRRVYTGDSPMTDPTRTYRFQRQILPYNARLYLFFENPQILIVRCVPNFLLTRSMPFLDQDLKVCETVTFVLTLVLYANAIGCRMSVQKMLRKRIPLHPSWNYIIFTRMEK